MRTKITTAAIFAVVIAGAITLVVRTRGQSSPPCAPSMVARLQQGLGTEVRCPASYSLVSSAVDNAAWCLQYRAGIVLSNGVKQQLINLEQSTINGEGRLTRTEVKNIITATFMNRVSSVTDSQIDNMAEQSFRVVPGLAGSNLVNGPQGNGVQLRGYLEGIGVATFKQKAREFRSGSTEDGAALRALAPAKIASEVETLCNTWAYACPNDWKVDYYSPFRVFLLTYALAADDHLADNHDECVGSMQKIEGWMHETYGITYSSNGRCPYGASGYVYKSPIDVFFDEATQTDLLNKYDAVH